MKKAFIHGLTAGLLAAIAAVVYSNAYSNALVVDFNKIVNAGAITGACLFGCIAASVGYYFFSKKVKQQTDVWFNVIFLMISFVSFLSPFSASLPIDVQSPELFVGLTIPMHLFPVVFWLATKPLFAPQPNGKYHLVSSSISHAKKQRNTRQSRKEEKISSNQRGLAQ